MLSFTQPELNLIALVLFLFANLVIGLRAGRRVTTLRDYALANRSLGSGVLAMSLFATLVSIEDVGIEMAYKAGVNSFLYPVLFAFVAVFIGWVVFPKLATFRQCTTVADVMGVLYGPSGYYSMLFASTIFSLIVMVGQLKVLAEIGAFFPFGGRLLVLLMGGLITLYSFWSGVRAVAATDVLQFVFVGAGFTALAFIAYQGFWDGAWVLGQTPSHLQPWDWNHLTSRLVSFFFWAIWPTLLISPPIVQRVLMANDRRLIPNMFAGFALLYLPLRLMMLLAGFKLLFHVGGAWRVHSFSLEWAITTLATHGGVQALFLVAVCAVILSTVDSYLNALAVLWGWGGLPSWGRAPSGQLRYARLATVLLGGITTLATLLLLDCHLLEFLGAAIVVLSSLVLPFLAGVLGLRGSRKAFNACLLSFFSCFVLSFAVLWAFRGVVLDFMGFPIVTRPYFPLMRLAWMGSIVLSAIVFFSIHYWEYGRFVVVDRGADGWKIARPHRFFVWRRLFPNGVVDWARQCVTRYGGRPYFFVLFVYTTLFVPYVAGPGGGRLLPLTIGLRALGFLWCGLLLLRGVWLRSLKPYFGLFYLGAIFYCVPLLNAVTSFQYPNDPFSVPNVLLGMTFLALLVDWKTFLAMEVLSLLLAAFCQKLVVGSALPLFSWGAWGVLLFGVFYNLFLCLFFKREKERVAAWQQARWRAERSMHTSALDAYMQVNRQLTEALHQESSMMQAIGGAVETLKETGGDSRAIQVIEDAAHHFRQVAHKSLEYLPLTLQRISLARLLEKAYRWLEMGGIDPSACVLLRQEAAPVELVCDPEAVQELIVNSVRYLRSCHRRAKVRFFIQKAALRYHFSKSEEERAVPALRFLFTTEHQPPAAPACYYLDGQQEYFLLPDRFLVARGIQTASAHYGVASFKEEGSLCRLEYVLPVDVGEIRPAIEYFSEEDLKKVTTLEGEKDQAFLAAVKKKGFSEEDEERIQVAMKVTKYCHRHQRRKLGGEPYYFHPLEVGAIVMDYTDDPDLVVAALLHDVLEDTACTLPQLRAMFGSRVASLVDDLTHLCSRGARKLKVSKRASLVALFDKGKEAPLLIKLADQLHNLRTLEGHSTAKQREKAEEVREYIFPVVAAFARSNPSFKAMEQEMQERVSAVLDR